MAADAFSLNTKYPVLIFKQGRSRISHGALGIARTLGRLGVPVYAIVEDNYTPLASSRYITKTFHWKSWPSDAEKFLLAMSAISGVIGHRAILVPMDDLSSIAVAENSAILKQWFLFPQLPSNLPRQLADKASFFSLCSKIGTPCARTIAPRSVDQIREFMEYIAFPMVLKAAQQWRLPNDDYYNPKVVHNREALFDIFERTQRGAGLPIVLQEYIAGEDWIYNGYCNREMNLYLNFTGRKLLDFPVGGGSTALGLSLSNEELCYQSEMLLRAVSYSGVCDMDWRRDKRDGQYKILDFNPRVGLNFQMFENSAAIDVVRALHLDLTGRKVDCAPMIEGRLLTVEPLYFRSPVRRRQTPLTAEKRSLAVTRRLAWWSNDDPLPFFVMSIRLLLQAILRRLPTKLFRKKM